MTAFASSFRKTQRKKCWSNYQFCIFEKTDFYGGFVRESGSWTFQNSQPKSHEKSIYHISQYRNTKYTNSVGLSQIFRRIGPLTKFFLVRKNIEHNYQELCHLPQAYIVRGDLHAFLHFLVNNNTFTKINRKPALYTVIPKCSMPIHGAMGALNQTQCTDKRTHSFIMVSGLCAFELFMKYYADNVELNAFDPTRGRIGSLLVRPRSAFHLIKWQNLIPDRTGSISTKCDLLNQTLTQFVSDGM